MISMDDRWRFCIIFYLYIFFKFLCDITILVAPALSVGLQGFVTEGSCFFEQGDELE